MIKTCELQTCDGKHTVELNDIVFAPDSKTLKKVSGETILHLGFDFSTIEKRMKFLEESIKNLTDESFEKNLEKEISEIRKVIIDLEMEFRNISDGYDIVRKNFKDLKSMAATSKELDDLKKSLDSIKKDLESKISSINAKSKNIEDKVAGIDKRLEDRVKDINSEITNLLKEIDDINSKLETNDSNHQKFKQNIDDINKKISGLSKKISDLQNEVEKDLKPLDKKVQSEISELQKNFKDLESKYKKLNDSINNINSKLKTNDSDHQKFKQDIDSLGNKTSKLSESLSDLQYEVEKKVKPLAEFNRKNIGDTDARVTKAFGRILELENTSRYLRDRINKLDSSVSNINNSINQINKRLEGFDELFINYKIDIDNLRKKIDSIPNLTKELQLGTINFRNKNGHTKIIFRSDYNYTSDYGYIEYKDNDLDYALWDFGETSKEHSALILGVENDGRNKNSDVVVLKSRAAAIVDAPEFYLRQPDGRFYSMDALLSRFPYPSFNSGWVTVTQDGLKISNPLGQDAFFIGYIKYDNGMIMQFGVYSSYEDDDNADDHDTGIYLIITDSELIVSVRKKNNNGTPSAVGITDGVSNVTPLQDKANIKIVGWKLPKGVV